MKNRFLFLLTLSAVLSGCSKEEPVVPQEPQDGGKRIPITITAGPWTRVTDTDYESGDKVGIYVVNYNGEQAGVLQNSGNHVDNMRFTYTTVWTPDKEIYWKDQTTKADLYCYYPYQTVTNVSAMPFSVKANQSAIADYKASEFLWGKASAVAPTENAVPIITNRTLSNMLVYVAPGKGFTEESLAAAEVRVEILNVKTASTINLTTGVATPTGEATTMVPYDEGDHYRALVVPQTVADGSDLVSVYVDGVRYTLNKGFTFKPNTRHKFTVTVNKVNGGIDIGVGGWEEDEEDNGGAAE